MRLVALIIALILALGAGFVVINVLGKKEDEGTMVAAKQPDVETTTILVAARPIPIGEVIVADMVRTQPWPTHLVLDGFVQSGDNSTNLIGMVTRASFQEGEPVLLTKLSNPDDPGFLAAGLPEGHKVATISVDAVSSVAGFTLPGDRVDVLVTHELPKPGAEDAEQGAGGMMAQPLSEQDRKEKVTETLLSNIKVLAIDHRATAGEPVDNTAANAGGDFKTPATISLEVTLEDAQKLRLAQETGYVSLALRSLKDKTKAETVPPTHIPNLTATGAFQPQPKKPVPVRVVRGIEINSIAGTQGVVAGTAAAGSVNAVAAGANVGAAAGYAGPSGSPYTASPVPGNQGSDDSVQAPQIGAPRIAR